jgi:hypothetical protein
MDSAIIEPNLTQHVDVAFRDRGRVTGELVRVRKQALFPRRHGDLVNTRGDERGEQCVLLLATYAFLGENPSEARSVMSDSIVTVIESRDANGHHFAFAPRERPGPMHDLAIQLVMLSHHGRVNRMDLDDVVRIRYALRRFEVLSGNIPDEGHGNSPDEDPREGDALGSRRVQSGAVRNSGTRH